MSKVAKSGLKFVKKRVAGHKKTNEDIEDAAYERELAIQAAREAGLQSNVHVSHQIQTVLPVRDEVDKDGDEATSSAGPVPEVKPEAKKSSEDWEAFNRLLGKVETAVATSNQAIEKVKEKSVVEEIIAQTTKEEIVIPEYKKPKSFEEAKKEKEELERAKLRQRREQDDWEKAFDATPKNKVPDLLLLGEEEAVPPSGEQAPKLSFAYYSPTSGIPKTPLEAEDPFDTSFIAPGAEKAEPEPEADDPFDTTKISEKIEEVTTQSAKRMSFSSGNPFGPPPTVQEDPNPRVRPPSRPTAGSSLFSSTECSPVDIPDDVQNFFKNASRRSSSNPFDPPQIQIPTSSVAPAAVPPSAEDTIRTGAALLQAIANEFADKDADDDDLYHRTLSSKGQLPPPSPMSPFSEPEEVDQTVPELMDVDPSASSAFQAKETPKEPVDPFADDRLINTDPDPPVLAPSTVEPMSVSEDTNTDAFQLAFGKKSIDLDDVPPSLANDYAPPPQGIEPLPSVKQTFDPFMGKETSGLTIPTDKLPGPVSNAPTPGSDILMSFEGSAGQDDELKKQEEELFGTTASSTPFTSTVTTSKPPPTRPEPPAVLNQKQNSISPVKDDHQSPFDNMEFRRDSAANSVPRGSIPKEGDLIGSNPEPQTLPKRPSIISPLAETNPFSPKNSQHASPATSPGDNPFAPAAVTRKSITSPENPFATSQVDAAPRKSVTSPENPFARSQPAAPRKSVTSPENPFAKPQARKSVTSPENPFGSVASKPKISPENPFAPSGFGTEAKKKKSVSSPENPFARSIVEKKLSPENPFAPSAKSVTSPVTSTTTRSPENPFSRKTSPVSESNPFGGQPLSLSSPPKKVVVGANNPFGGDPEPVVEPVTTFSSILDNYTSATEEFDDSTIMFANASADPFDTENLVPITDPKELDAFNNKFAQASGANDDSYDPFDLGGTTSDGDMSGGFGTSTFGGDDSMDYLNDGACPMPQVPDNTPIKRANLGESKDSFDDDDEVENLKITIRPKLRPLQGGSAGIPTLAAPPKLLPPPKSPSRQAGYQVQPDRFNPFDKGSKKEATVSADDDLFSAFNDVLGEGGKEKKEDAEDLPPALGESGAKQAEPLSPSTPLYDEDISQPIPEWKTDWDGEGWEFFLRWPNKKKFTGTRYWKPVYVKFNDTNILWVMNKKDDSDPIQEVPLQGCYSLSEMAHQPFDQYNKIFTIKLQYTFYKETVGVRKGQIAKVISGQVNSMGSVAKLGLPLQHAPQLTQLLKLGTPNLHTVKTFVSVIEDTLFRLQIHRDRALSYKAEEIQATLVDEYEVVCDKTGHVCSQTARVRLFFLAFVNGMPDVEVGINELSRQGKEIVGRHDIMPIVTEEWIRVEGHEFHACVDAEEFEKTKVIKLRPPDATFFEMMRFRVRPPRQRELPIQLTAVLRVTPPKVQLRADVLVPGYSSRKHGQIPCEEIAMFFPIPECWVYLFRVEKHFRYGALKSAARRPGKIKGLERIMGAAAGGNIEKNLIEVSAGVAKYEPAHKSIVWRVPRLPKEGQGAYTQQLMVVDLELTSFDQIPDTFDTELRVEFTMPASTVSHTTVRSISCPTDADLPVEKFVRYIARHNYKVEMDVIIGTEADTAPKQEVTQVEAKVPTPSSPPQMVRQPADPSDSDDSD